MIAEPTRGGVFHLLKYNAPFRRLWLAEFISFAGDWFTLVALVRLVHEATGMRLATGFLLAAQLAPSLLLSSLAGSAADRMSRKSVMITCDLLRAAGALGFLSAPLFASAGAGPILWIFTLVLFQHSVTAFFRPAASASVPKLVTPQELSSAGTLEGLSWSLGLVVGSGLGGAAVDFLGIPACFAIDSASFLASAALLRTIPLPHEPAARAGTQRYRLYDFGELFAEMKRNKSLVPAVLAKCAWGVGAAQLLLLTEFGDRLLGAAAASTGFGLLYASRGVGTALGPALARRALGESDGAIRRSISLGFLAAAAFYVIFGLGPPLPVALLCIAGAHGGGSMIWIGATVLVQRSAPDRVRGRAFAFEMALHTVTACAFPLAAGALCDAGVEPAYLVLIFAAATALLGGAWTVAAWRMR